MRPRSRWRAATVRVALVAAAALPIGVAAQTPQSVPTTSSPARDASLRALADRLDLPLIEEAIMIFSTQLRRTLPSYFVEQVGQGADLGPQWRRGNPAFDSALRQVDAALAAEEVRGGPLLRLEHSDLLYAVNIPWTQADIAFIDETLGTELGREAQRAIDAKAALQTTHTLKRRVAAGPGGAGIADAFNELDSRANAQFGDASLLLLALRATDPQRAQRLQRLLEGVTTAPSDAIGQRVTERLSQRLIAAATAQLPNLLSNILDFRTRPP